jgi:hypothetical protein
MNQLRQALNDIGHAKAAFQEAMRIMRSGEATALPHLEETVHELLQHQTVIEGHIVSLNLAIDGKKNADDALKAAREYLDSLRPKDQG